MRVALYLGAHPDDVELGCAGTIVKNSPREQAVVVAFSSCDVNTGLIIQPNQIAREFRESMRVLGVTRFRALDFENTKFRERADDVRNYVEKLREEIAPDVVYITSIDDLHQDHTTLAVESLRAFRRGKEEIRCYETGSTLRGFNPNVFVDIGDTMDVKVEALMCYKSQYERHYHREEVFKSKAMTRGTMVRMRYAEAFELIRRCE